MGEEKRVRGSPESAKPTWTQMQNADGREGSGDVHVPRGLGTRLLSAEAATKRHTEGLVKLDAQIATAGTMFAAMQANMLEAETKLTEALRDHERRMTLFETHLSDASNSPRSNTENFETHSQLPGAPPPPAPVFEKPVWSTRTDGAFIQGGRIAQLVASAAAAPPTVGTHVHGFGNAHTQPDDWEDPQNVFYQHTLPQGCMSHSYA